MPDHRVRNCQSACRACGELRPEPDLGPQYGVFVGRTPDHAYTYFDSFAPVADAFFASIKQLPEYSAMAESERPARVQHAAGLVLIDPSPSGERYSLIDFARCEQCGGTTRTLSSVPESAPHEWTMMPEATFTDWCRMPVDGREALIRKALST